LSLTSESLLIGETASRPTEGTVIFRGVPSNEQMGYPQKAKLFGTPEIFDFLVHQEQE